MIGKQTGRALELIDGIEMWRETGESFWHGMVVRILMELDMAGAHDEIKTIADVLAKMWQELPVLEKPRRPLDWPPEMEEVATQGGAG